MKPRMRRPHVTSTEDKVRESVLINALLKSKNMKQLELARLLGYKPDAIGQWFHKTKADRDTRLCVRSLRRYIRI